MQSNTEERILMLHPDPTLSSTDLNMELAAYYYLLQHDLSSKLSYAAPCCPRAYCILCFCIFVKMEKRNVTTRRLSAVIKESRCCFEGFFVQKY